MGAHVLYVGLHYIAYNFVFSSQQQILHGDYAQQLPPAVRDVAGVYGLLLHPRAAYALEGLLDGHAPLQVHVLHGHDAPGAVLGIVQHLVYHSPGLAVHVAQYLLHNIGGHLLYHVHRVVQKQLLHHLVQLPVAEALHQQLLTLGLHIGEGVRRQLLWQQPEQNRHPLLRQLLQYPRGVGRVHILNYGPRPAEPPLLQQLRKGPKLLLHYIVFHRCVPPSFFCENEKHTAPAPQERARESAQLYSIYVDRRSRFLPESIVLGVQRCHYFVERSLGSPLLFLNFRVISGADSKRV